MIGMIGQFELVNKLNNLTLATLPHACLLIGEYGCGKHLFITELVNKLDIECIDITENLSDELILEYQVYTNPRIYIIDSRNLKEKSQNIILKFLEEPSDFAYIFILCESINGLLPTILNRCQQFKFVPYSKAELIQFSKLPEPTFDVFMSVLNTPGKLIAINDQIENYTVLITKIFDFIDKAIISNILVLPEKLNYSNNGDVSKLNFELFCSLLSKIALNYYIDTKISLTALILTNTFIQNSKIFNIDKQKLYERYLIDLKDELKRYKDKNN